MKNTRLARQSTVAALAVGFAFLFAPAGRADTLSFNGVPAASAAATMSRRLGVTVIFRGTVDKNRPVTFSVDDPDASGGRLQAVSELADALNLDFQKVYVVSKLDAGMSPPAVKIDSNGPVIFSSTTVSAREAIQTVAAVDSALVQISDSVTGNVTFHDPRMTAVQAAALIARQTGTEWKAYYGLFPRGQEPARLGGVVLDHTNGGQPITELPVLTFRNQAIVSTTIDTSQFSPLTPFGVPSDGIISVANNSGIFPTGGFSPFGYGGFGGYDPYGYGGYNPYGGYGTVTGPVAAPTTPAPTGPAAVTTTAPAQTILPDFPFSGSVGGQTMVGGY